MTTVNPYAPWQVYPGKAQTSLALPDYYSNYIAYTFDAMSNPVRGMCIKGRFPNARYMSFNVYATKEGTSLGALTDYQMWGPTPQSNPFVAGNPTQNTDYTVYVLPLIQDRLPRNIPQGVQNILYYNPNKLERGQLTVVLRYYVPEGNEFGGVPLPTVTGYNALNGEPSGAPAPLYPNMDEQKPIFENRLRKIFETAQGDTLRFYHSVGQGQFNNADNIYLISAVKGVVPGTNAVVLKVRPPTYPTSPDRFDQTAVRYWSINQGNPDTSTPFGMMDSEFGQAPDGYVYVVMGGPGVEEQARKRGYNYMPWKANQKQAVIIYRNMLTMPQYRGSITRVPNLPTAANTPPYWDKSVLASYEAGRFLPDYAPSGQVVTEQELNKGLGGAASPGFAYS
ncbi:MAG TPA: hypothetical protein VEY09_15105 [Pyrinomonadaceae bacterium]|nr:hypothetical protein [Pyrinomonadaceae bacterium]